MNKLNQLSQLQLKGVWQLHSIGAHSKFNKSDSLSWKLNNGKGTNQIANWKDVNFKLEDYITLPSSTSMTKCPTYSNISSVFNSGYKLYTETSYKSNQLVKYSDLDWNYNKVVEILSTGSNKIPISFTLVDSNYNPYTIWWEVNGNVHSYTSINYNSTEIYINPQAWLSEVPYPMILSFSVDGYSEGGSVRSGQIIINLYGSNPGSSGSISWNIKYTWDDSRLINTSYTKEIYEESYNHVDTKVDFPEGSSIINVSTGGYRMTGLQLYWS